MEALHAAISMSEVVSIDSDISRIHEAYGDKACSQRRGRKQAKPLRSAFSSDTPSESQPQADAQQQPDFLLNPSHGDSPILNNHAGIEEIQAAVPKPQTISSSSNKGGKNSPAQRHGPCGHCKTPYSPQWRKGPRNKPVLCNACGIRYLRNRHLGRSVPQKKRCSVSSVKTAAHADSMCETSADTMTDTSDMRTHSRKRRAKQSDMADEDISTYSYDASQQETAGSVGSFQQLFLQQQHHHQHTYSDTAADTDAATGHSSDVSVPDNGISGAAGATAAADASGVHFGTSLALPGNMQQQFPLTMHSLATGGGLLSGSYSMALALQIYQQQQQQLLYNQQQQLLMSQGSSDTSGLQCAAANLSNISTAAPVLQSQTSYTTGSLSSLSQHSAAGQTAAATTCVPLLFSQSMQMQNLHSYLLQQHQQSHVLHSASMLHGPSPLSAMSSASFGHSLAGLGGAGSFTAMLQAPVSTTLPEIPALEIAPLVCGDYPVSTALPSATTAAAAVASTGATAAPSTVLLGGFQSLLAS